MTMMRVGFVGWRGMVGSVLMERMRAERDFEGLESVFFSTSNVSGKAPPIAGGDPVLADAHDLETLKRLDAVVSCQGGGYTTQVYDALRNLGFEGYWIDAASTLRMRDDSAIVLDPVNRALIDESLAGGIKAYVGGNCTVSLMLMALGGLFRAGLVEWLSTMTYQAASGAGAKNMVELVEQMSVLARSASVHLEDPASGALELEGVVTDTLRSKTLPTEQFGVPLAASLLPWIDRPVEHGQTREEWKGLVETAKILGHREPIPIDGICVRVGALRCHSQAFTLKLVRPVPLDELTGLIEEANPWVEIVPNEKEATLTRLTPAAITGTLAVPVGRLRPMRLGPDYITAFSVGDQLLWGAAEPLRRMLRILREYLGR